MILMPKQVFSSCQKGYTLLPPGRFGCLIGSDLFIMPLKLCLNRLAMGRKPNNFTAMMLLMPNSITLRPHYLK